MANSKFLREVEKLLKSTGREFAIIERKRHFQVIFVGACICTISEDNGQRERDTRAIQSAMNRRIRELECHA